MSVNSYLISASSLRNVLKVSAHIYWTYSKVYVAHTLSNVRSSEWETNLKSKLKLFFWSGRAVFTRLVVGGLSLGRFNCQAPVKVPIPTPNKWKTFNKVPKIGIWSWKRAWSRYPSSQLLWYYEKLGLYTIYCQSSSAYLHRNPRSSPLAWWKNARWHLYSINLVGDKLNLDIKPFEPICKVGMIWIPNVSLVPVK